MPKIRVLVVDDSVVVRRIVTEALAGDPGIEVAATAPNGRIALTKLTQVNPDVVTLDVEMPVLDGLATLKELRQTHPRLPVIMFSTLTDRGAATTLDALALGANDYVTKPANVGSVTTAQQRVREELVPKIRALCGHGTGLVATPSPVTRLSPSKGSTTRGGPSAPRSRIDVVTIGVSTGGPNALAEVIPKLPADFPVPVVIVQHMPPVFTRLLAERLNAISAVQVGEGSDGMPLTPGHVWLAPGNMHMTVRTVAGVARLALNQDPPENSCRPAADVLFRSVVDAYGGNTLGVVLTGMGQDGLRGCARIVEAGGRVLAQDRTTSVVWGMPGFVANAGYADAVLPLDQIAPAIVQRVREGRTRSLAVSVR